MTFSKHNCFYGIYRASPFLYISKAVNNYRVLLTLSCGFYIQNIQIFTKSVIQFYHLTILILILYYFLTLQKKKFKKIRRDVQIDQPSTTHRIRIGGFRIRRTNCNDYRLHQHLIIDDNPIFVV